MAVNPGDARLPRYREGTALPVFRKQSASQGLCLYLTNRDIWSNLMEVAERKEATGSETADLPECGGPELPAATDTYETTHHGIIEGIVHVNPWLLDIGTYVYAEVAAYYHYARSELDPFDCEVNKIVFLRRCLLNPPRHYDRDGSDAMRRVPEELRSYSSRTRKLYDKIGGPVGGKAMLDENLSASGVLAGMAGNTRQHRTFVPQTRATIASGTPDHPFVTYNFPFRFDINGTPDSMYLKQTPRPTRDGSTPPPDRMKLFYQAIFGFAHHDSDTDPDSPSESEDSGAEDELRIREPGEAIIRRKLHPSKEKKKRQWEKDLFHPDAYPWRPRPKRAPRDGVSWVVRAYATSSPGTIPKSRHTTSLRFRKLSYLPLPIGIACMDYPRVYTDYCLAVGPRTGQDGGVITLLGKLDRAVYAPGEPVQCDIKFHNSSVRVVHRIIVEAHQCLRIQACSSRVWRSLICRRCITDMNLQTGMPMLPGTENLRIRVTLNPWPTRKSITEAMNKSQGPLRPSGVLNMEEAWAIHLPRIPGQEFALETPGRHEPVPPHHIQRRSLAQSSMSGTLEHLLSVGRRVDLQKPLGEPDSAQHRDIWTGSPHRHCRCKHRKHRPGEPSRTDRMPPKEPYQVPVGDCDTFPEDEVPNERKARQNTLQPFCRQCLDGVDFEHYPIHISYEIVVQAELLPQHEVNPLSGESAIRQSGLGSGLLIDPHGEIIGPDGPRIVLPCMLVHKKPYPEERVPLANVHIDQRQDCSDHFPVEPKIHEPSLGRGFFKSKDYPIAPCTVMH